MNEVPDILTEKRTGPNSVYAILSFIYLFFLRMDIDMLVYAYLFLEGITKNG